MNRDIYDTVTRIKNGWVDDRRKSQDIRELSEQLSSSVHDTSPERYLIRNIGSSLCSKLFKAS